MFEKVHKQHPDKVADRIAGAIVDIAYNTAADPKVAVEVMIGHGNCYVIIETDAFITHKEIEDAIKRIAGDVESHITIERQDPHLAKNQEGKVRCGDNGIFKGTPITSEQSKLAAIARWFGNEYPTDGKYILDGEKLIICQSHATTEELKHHFPHAIINPLGCWEGGPDVDTGCTNRKLGSDMGDSVTGGGLHGKDCSKADVSLNIYAHLKAQETGEPVMLSCAIGDEEVDGRPYSEIVEIAKEYIREKGGFEKFAEWGLI